MTGVSIHAPARGATVKKARESFASFRFQFTLPRGERQSAMSACIEYHSFNSRSREGSDCEVASIPADHP